MSFYSAKVKDAEGVRREILREAENAADAAAQLRAEGYLVLDVEDAKGQGGMPGAWHPAWLLPMTGFDVEMGLRQAAAMLRSGVSLLAALETVGSQARRPRAGDAMRSRCDLPELGEHLVHDHVVQEHVLPLALLALLGGGKGKLFHLALHGVILANEAAQGLGLRAGQADSLSAQQLLAVTLRRVFLAAQAAGHAETETPAVAVHAQAGLAALTADHRTGGRECKGGAAGNDALVADGAKVPKGAHFFLHIDSSHEADFFVL